MASRLESDVPTLQLVRDLLSDIRTLLRQEVALARAEVREELTRLVEAVALFAVATATLAIAGLWMLVAATRGLAYMFGWPLGGVYGGIGIALGIIGVALLAVVWRQAHRLRLLPKTRETLREQTHWAARRVRKTA